MNSSARYKGSCFCGAVEIEVSGTPAAMGYCHCESCRQWSAGPVNAFTLWPPGAVTVTRGQEQLKTYAKTDNSHRRWCARCGGHVMTNHPAMGLVDVYAAILPGFDYRPELHVFYGESVLALRDGLPKFKDIPAEMGGSGDLLPE